MAQYLYARALSQDGQTLLFAETALGTNYAVCLRKTDGSPVLRLGEEWPAIPLLQHLQAKVTRKGS